MLATGAIILAFDLGTTNLKAAMVNESGELVAIARRPPPATFAHGRAEMTVADFHAALLVLVDELAGLAELRNVQAVSFASQANSFAIFDAQDIAITPIVLWPDERAAGIDQPLNAIPDLRAITGVPAVDHQFAQSKLRWFAANNPQIAEAARKVSFIGDIFCRWLTGVHVSEPGLACLTALASLAEPRWIERHIASLNLPVVQWPKLLLAGADVGPILPAMAERLAIARSARLFMGCLDQYAGSIGTGAAVPESVSETSGTVLAAVRFVSAGALSQPSASQSFEGPSFLRDRTFRMTFSSTSANLLEWYRNEHARHASFDELIRLAEASPTAASVRRVGAGGPVAAVDAAEIARGAGHVVKGIMHRVCDELASLLDGLGATGLAVRSAGGASRSDAWLQMKADRLNVPILATSAQEPACLGAAMLAASGLGIGSVDTLAGQWCKPRMTFFHTEGGASHVRS